MEFPNACGFSWTRDLGSSKWIEAWPIAVAGVAPDLVALAAWIKKDGMGLSALAGAVDESIIGLLTSCTTSNQIREKLKIVHDQRAQESVHHVHENFYK